MVLGSDVLLVVNAVTEHLPWAEQLWVQRKEQPGCDGEPGPSPPALLRALLSP